MQLSEYFAEEVSAYAEQLALRKEGLPVVPDEDDLLEAIEPLSLADSETGEDCVPVPSIEASQKVFGFNVSDQVSHHRL